MHKVLMEAVSSKLIALEQMLACSAMMIVASQWEKIQNWMTSHYTTIEIWESVVITLFYIYFLIKWNPYVYFIADLIYFVVLGSVFQKVSVTCYTKLFKNNQERIDADTAFDFFASLASIVGFGIGVCYSPSLTACIWLFLFGDLARTISKVYTYKPENITN